VYTHGDCLLLGHDPLIREDSHCRQLSCGYRLELMSLRNAKMVQWVYMFHKKIIFMKSGRKALINLQARIDLQVLDDLKFMLQVDYISFIA
jgi:hypothetical protein